MKHIETNVFPIKELENLKYRYRLYKIRGLDRDHEEFEKNRNILVDQLSYKMWSPVTIIMKDGEPHLVLREDAQEPPSPYQLVRATAYFDKTGDTLTLDFSNPSQETIDICQRFLQFAVQGALWNHRDLWSPGSGKAHFYRRPRLIKNGVCIYMGHSVRVIHTIDNSFCVCIDIKHRYVRERALPANISKEDFRRQYLKGSGCVYHFGNDWYEIKIHEHSGLSIREKLVPKRDGSGDIPLIEYVKLYSRKPLTKEVLALDDDCSCLHFFHPSKTLYSAPAQLCYPVYQTDDLRVMSLHKQTILPPWERRKAIHTFMQHNLSKINLDDVTLHVDSNPVGIPKNYIKVPDLLFGNNTVLSLDPANEDENVVTVDLQSLGNARLGTLLDKEIGVFTRKPMSRQYFIWPQTVVDSYGAVFLEQLKRSVNDFLPEDTVYEPVVVTYNDHGPRTFAAQGKAILETIDSTPREPGYGIVMIHDVKDNKSRDRDQLAAMLMRKLREKDLYVSVIHTSTAEQSYELSQTNGKEEYVPVSASRGKLSGYLRNVALTKVLLTNEYWPFVLNNDLHADLTIGIDVSQNTACFILFGKGKDDIRSECRDSNQKENIGRRQIKGILLDLLRDEHKYGMTPPKNIVIHRDGRFFRSEQKGILDALAELKYEGIVDKNVDVSFVEILKNSPVAIRFFDVEGKSNGSPRVYNPQVGAYWQMTNDDVYIATTGRAFLRKGTAGPLHIKCTKAAIPLKNIVEDIYALSCLTWTSPKSCSRIPMTIRLADIRLTEHAGGFDEDTLTYGEDDEE